MFLPDLVEGKTYGDLSENRLGIFLFNFFFYFSDYIFVQSGLFLFQCSSPVILLLRAHSEQLGR